MQEENLTAEELVSMGLSPMPLKKPAARKPEKVHSRSTSPETTTELGKRTLIIPVMRLPVSGSVTLEGKKRKVKVKSSTVSVNPDKDDTPPPPPNSEDSAELMEINLEDRRRKRPLTW